jgi:hypothetical protein
MEHKDAAASALSGALVNPEPPILAVTVALGSTINECKRNKKTAKFQLQERNIHNANEYPPLLTGVQRQPVVPGTGGEKHQQVSLHVAAEAHLGAHVVILPEDHRRPVTPDPADEFPAR